MYQMSHNSNYLPRSTLPHLPFTRRERERLLIPFFFKGGIVRQSILIKSQKFYYLASKKLTLFILITHFIINLTSKVLYFLPLH